jgi:hypothetical protein
MMPKSKFEPLQKKFSLPGFELLDREFEISSIESEEISLRNIRKKIEEKVKTCSLLLEEVLQPETSLAGIYESATFSEAEKKQLFDLYRQIMKANRKCAELGIRNDEQADADFISSFSESWNKLKTQLIKAIEKLGSSWDKDIEEHERLGYLG